MFSSIDVVRSDVNGQEVERVAVPITYSNKEKWVQRIVQDPELTRQPAITLPRMAFEMVGLAYNPERRLNRLQKVNFKTPAGNTVSYTPTTWDLQFNLYIATKTQDEVMQIVEQILPAFSPDYNLELVGVQDPKVKYIVPVTLLDVQPSDNYEGQLDDRRIIIWSVSFVMKSYLFGQIRQGSLIKQIHIDIDGYDQTTSVDMDIVPFLEGVPLEQIMKTDNWVARVTIEE